MKSCTFTASQENAMKLFDSGRNVFLSGEAGTGKSFVLNAYLEKIRGKKNVFICAPTGIAAINVGGVTLHRAFQIPMHPLGPCSQPENISKSLLQADVIVIDEISMCQFDVFQYVAQCIFEAEMRSGKRKQLIVVGDFYQLPPVITGRDRTALFELWGCDVGDGYAFQAPLWGSFQFEHAFLKEIVRQKDDTAFLECLNKLRHGDKSVLNWINSNSNKSASRSIYLCPTNKEADGKNAAASQKLKGEYHDFKATVRGRVSTQDRPTSTLLRLKVGMQVMSIINDSNGLFQNGSLGIIKNIADDSSYVIVAFDNGNEAKLGINCWVINDYEVTEDGQVEQKPIGWFFQLPLKVAYAITIHKSQGQTFTDMNLNPSCFSNGQLYVAISRLTSISGLHLTRQIRSGDLQVSDDVLRFCGGV